MANFSQLRGMLLEEAILYLLRVSGYKTVDTADSDSSLEIHAAGLAVKGRGGRHQIDAIADFTVTPPFSHPQRLLLEAKCHNFAGARSPDLRQGMRPSVFLCLGHRPSASMGRVC